MPVGLRYTVRYIENHGVLLLQGIARDPGGAFVWLMGKNARMTPGFLSGHLVLVSFGM